MKRVINFTKQENDMLKEILERDGYRNITEIVRMAVRSVYEKRSPKQRGKKGELTYEQLCAERGGSIIEEEGRTYCRTTSESGMITDTPVENL